MHSFSLTKTLAALSCSLALVACGPPDEASRAKTGPIVGSFLVSDFYTPSGLMGDGAIPGLLVADANPTECSPIDKTDPLGKRRLPRPLGTQGDCYHFTHHIGAERWSGAYWVYPSNSWGSIPGRDLYGPLDQGLDDKGRPMRGYTRVRFWAAIDALPKPPTFNFFVGGIDGSTAKPARPYKDLGCQIFLADPTTDPPSPRQVFCDDIPFKVTGTDTIDNTWKQYVIPLTQWGVSNVIGGFGWSINDNDNPGQTISMYFDDIVWE